MARQRFNPARGVRGTAGYEYYELSLALGPEQVGITGDNSYEVLYGREWMMLVDAETRELRLYQQDEVGSWTRVTTGLPGLFDSPIPEGPKRFTFAFDQSARVIVVYEQAGLIFVTRWNPFTNAYVQNVSFAGTDPCLLMDATVADPRGFPAAADGWGVREAYYAGIRVLYEWIPDGVFRDTPIPDSDVVLFYLTPDRLEVKARAQRQLYATVNNVWTFTEPVVMDRAVALSGKYQLLVGDAAGDKRDDMLISNAYIEDYIINPRPVNGLPSSVIPEALRLETVVFKYLDTNELDALVAVDNMRVEQQTLLYPWPDPLDVGVAPEAMVQVIAVVAVSDINTMDSSVGVELIRVEVQTIQRQEEEALDATVAVEAIRVQAV
jgi:hypothetical protein